MGPVLLRLPGQIIGGMRSDRVMLPSPGSSLPELALPGSSWVKLDCMRAGVGLVCSSVHGWDFVPSVDAAEKRSGRPIACWLPILCSTLQIGHLV